MFTSLFFINDLELTQSCGSINQMMPALLYKINSKMPILTKGGHVEWQAVEVVEFSKT